MAEARVIAVVRRSLLRHLNGHPDRSLYANLVGKKVALVLGTERGENNIASVEVVPLAAPESCPTRLRMIFLEVLSQQPQVRPAAVKTAKIPTFAVLNRPAPKPNGNGREEPKRRVLLHKRPKPGAAFKAIRQSGHSRGLR